MVGGMMVERYSSMNCAHDPEATLQLKGTKKAMKCGYLQRYQRRLFGKDWRETYVVLYDDSTIAWFKNQGKPEPDGGLLLQDAPELMAVGAFTLRVPARPDLPGGQNIRQLMAFGVRNKRKVHWFLARTEDDANDWMTAISNTLPLPPQPSVYVEAEENVYETIDIDAYKSENETKATILPTSSSQASIATISEGNQRKVNCEEGDIAATGLLLSTGAWSWGNGWGCGSGWGNYTLYKTIDVLTLSPLELNGSSPAFQYDDYNESEFDADFGGDFAF